MAEAAGIDDDRVPAARGKRPAAFHDPPLRPLDGGERSCTCSRSAALAHFDFNQAGAYSYEQALLTIRQLELPMEAVEQQFRRMAFNVVARNQDDHVKNIAFLMDSAGRWSLSPAFDVTYSYKPRTAAGRAAPDDDERQARRVHAGRFSQAAEGRGR